MRLNFVKNVNVRTGKKKENEVNRVSEKSKSLTESEAHLATLLLTVIKKENK